MPKSKNKGKKAQKRTGKRTSKGTARKKQPPRASRDDVRQLVQTVLDADEDYIGTLRSIVASTPDAGEHLVWLTAYDFDGDVAKAAGTLLTFAAEGEVPISVYEALRESAEPVLLQAIRNKALPDPRKLGLLAVYNEMCGELPQHEIDACFGDAEAAFHSALAEAARTVTGEPEAVEAVLEGAFALPGSALELEPEAENLFPVFATGIEACKHRPERASLLLFPCVAIAAEFQIACDVAAAALKAMKETECGQAAWCLAELGRMPGMGELGELAAKLAAEMAHDEIAEELTLQRSFRSGKATGVDGSGARGLRLYFKRPDGCVDAVVILISHTSGIKSVWCSYGTDEEFEDEFIFAAGPPSASSTLEFARELIADALVAHEENNLPIPGSFFIHRPCLGAQPILPARRTPDLQAYKLDNFERSPKLVEGSAEIADLNPYSLLTFTSDAAYEYLDQTVPGEEDISEKDFDVFVREIASQEKEKLIRLMAMNLEIDALGGHAGDPLHILAAGTWLAMNEDIVPFHEIPFVRKLSRISVENILLNLDEGFQNQQEVNEAGLVMDDELFDALEEEDEMEWEMPE